jgi:CheY-like chemotaxis protein
VVVVEDNRDGAETLACLLRLEGYRVHVARDGREGLEAIEMLRPDVVLVDIGLPKINGYDVVRCVRKQPWGAAMGMLALTGWGQRRDLEMSRAAGFDLHLLKPVEDGILLHALRTVVMNKRLPSSACATGMDQAN